MKGEGSIDIAANARAATWSLLLLFPLLSGVPIAAGSAAAVADADAA